MMGEESILTTSTTRTEHAETRVAVAGSECEAETAKDGAEKAMLYKNGSSGMCT